MYGSSYKAIDNFNNFRKRLTLKSYLCTLHDYDFIALGSIQINTS